MTPNYLLPLLLLIALLAPCVVAAENVTLAGVGNYDPQQQYATKAFSYNIDEPITYPQEYYKLSKESQEQYTSYNTITENPNFYASLWGCASGIRYIVLELRRQTILMEKQNELLVEQVALLRLQQNAKLQCTKKVWEGTSMVMCQEYAWVGGA